MTSSYLTKLKKLISGLWVVNKDYISHELVKRKIHTYQSTDIERLYHQVHHDYQPCFVLSTGRCGTSLLTKILNGHKDIMASHNPSPEMAYHNGFAFNNFKEKSEEVKASIDGARYEALRDAYILGKVYVETNPRITFFAYQLADLFPKARFIHLYRHPIAVIESGLSRKWYADNTIREEGRIMMEDQAKWGGYSQQEKIAWSWQATNAFVEGFKQKVESDRVLTVQAESLFKNWQTSRDTFQHIGVRSLDQHRITELINKPINKQYKKKSIDQGKEDLLNLTPLVRKYYDI